MTTSYMAKFNKSDSCTNKQEQVKSNKKTSAESIIVIEIAIKKIKLNKSTNYLFKLYQSVRRIIMQ